MAARKPSKPTKKPAPARLLGNDPFARGAAVREAKTDAPSSAPLREQPQTPELQTRRPVLQPLAEKPKSTPLPSPSQPTPVWAPPKSAPTVVVPRPSAKKPAAPDPTMPAPVWVSPPPSPPMPQPVWGTLDGPTAHAASPVAEALDGPTAHAASPIAEELDGPTAHAASPVAEALDGPTAHAASPIAEELDGPTAHAASPIAEELDGPTAHAASPIAEELDGPTAHAASPIAEELDGPTAHAASPIEELDGPTAHAASPIAEELDGPTGHAASPSAEELADEPDAAPLAPQASPSGTGVLSGLVTAIRSATGLSSRAVEVDRWGKDTQLASALRPLGELLYDKYWRVRVEGAEHLPTGPFIIVANHAGALPLDGPVLHLALRRERPELPESRWLLEDQVFHAPFIGVLANRLGAVRANPENAVRLLGEGRPVVVFPEGFHGLSKPFSERYQLRRFGRGGYVKIALRAKVPIVPAAILGGEESMPLLGKLPGGLFGVEYLPVTLPPLPARWHIRFAEPVSLDGAPSEPEHDLAWVERKNLAVRDQIEAMLTHMLQHRDSVF